MLVEMVFALLFSVECILNIYQHLSLSAILDGFSSTDLSALRDCLLHKG